MGARHTRLAAALAAAWESEVVSARRMTMLAERLGDSRGRARLMVLAAFCRAHASRLLAHIIALGRGRGCRLVTLEVRRSNAAAARLYRRFGFRAVGVRPNYYAEDQEDAIVMLLDLT